MKNEIIFNLDTEYDQVFIIDCLPEDEYFSCSISQDLVRFFEENEIDSRAKICRTKKEVEETLQDINEMAISGTKFCLHIVSHGSETGLLVGSSKEKISWADFTRLLEQVNKAMSETLIVNMTSCKGLHGIKIVDGDSLQNPFFGLIGYSVDLYVNQGKMINRLFYEKIMEGKKAQEAVEEIRNQLNDENLYCMTSQGFKRIKNI